MVNFVPRYFAAILAIGCWTAASHALRAQQPNEFNRLYGQGVNAYFAGRSSEAESYLSQAMALESEDPRLYYFRALSLLRLGRINEARGDMMVGAAIEARRPQRFAVGRALERVQGSQRLMLEQYRRQARSEPAAVIPSQSAPPQPTFSQPQQTSYGDEGALRQRIVIPLDRLLGPGSPRPLTAEELSRRTQQARAPQLAPSGPTRVAPPSPNAGDDPFQDDPASVASQGAASESAQPEAETAQSAEMADAEETPEAEAATGDGEDPFGDFE